MFEAVDDATTFCGESVWDHCMWALSETRMQHWTSETFDSTPGMSRRVTKAWLKRAIAFLVSRP